MRDFAYEEVALGNGVETMATPLVFSSSTCIEGTPIPNTEVFMSFDDFKGRYVPASALGPAIVASKKLIAQLSPHSHEDWIDAFSIEDLKSIPLCKIQVEGAQRKTTHSSQDDAAAEDVVRTARAANHARDLFARSQDGMSGEDFVNELNESPDIDLSRQILRKSYAGGAEVTSPSGSVLTLNNGKATPELPCADVQIVKIKVANKPSKPGYTCVTVVDPLEHAEFWKFFPEKSMDLEVVDADDQQSLLLSRVIDESVTVELNVTVLPPHGRLTRESIQASLSKSLDVRGLAQRVVQHLNSQFDLKF